MLFNFISFELGKIRKYFKTGTVAKSIISAIFIGLFLAIGIGMYHFFTSSFRYINVEAEEAIKQALLLFLYELFLLVLAGISVFSTAITSLFNLFQSDRNNWILSSPGYRNFPQTIFIKSLFGTTIILISMFLPAFLSIATVYHLPISALILIFTSVLFFSVIINTLTLISLILIAYTYYVITSYVKVIHFTFKGLVALLISITSLLLFSVWRIIKNIDLVELFKGRETDNLVTVSSMASHFTLMPTHPFAMEILNFQIGLQADAFHNFSRLGIFALILTVVWFIISRLYYPLWQKLQDGASRDKEYSSSLFRNTSAYIFTGSLSTVLFKKEMLISSRNLKGVLWFFFLISVWFMQLAANILLNHNVQKYQDDINPRMVSLQMIQYIIAIYFISAFTLRFVFPSFSTERKTKWILGSAPVSFIKIFFSKYFFYTTFFIILGVVMNYINSFALHLTATHTVYLMILFVTVITFIVTFGLTLGALFPSTETDDPEVISTSMPGLFFTAIALIYGGISDGVLYLTLTQNNSLWLILFVLFTIFVIILTLLKVPQFIATRGPGII